MRLFYFQDLNFHTYKIILTFQIITKTVTNFLQYLLFNNIQNPIKHQLFLHLLQISLSSHSFRMRLRICLRSATLTGYVCTFLFYSQFHISLLNLITLKTNNFFAKNNLSKYSDPLIICLAILLLVCRLSQH